MTRVRLVMPRAEWDGQVVAAQVGFGFHDDAGGGAVNQDLAEQSARDLDRGASVEGSREDAAEV